MKSQSTPRALVTPVNGSARDLDAAPVLPTRGRRVLSPGLEPIGPLLAAIAEEAK